MRDLDKPEADEISEDAEGRLARKPTEPSLSQLIRGLKAGADLETEWLWGHAHTISSGDH